MTSETRRIIFSAEELIQAITKLRRDEKQPLPESRIRGAKIESGEGPVPQVSLVLDPAGGVKGFDAGFALDRFWIEPEASDLSQQAYVEGLIAAARNRDAG